MKKIITISLFIIWALSVNATKSHTFIVEVISNEVEQINGKFVFETKITFKDTVLWTNNPSYTVSENWQIRNITNITGQTFYPNDEIIFEAELQYTVSNIPYYQKKIVVRYTDNSEIINTYFKVYFTPYNTVEI